MADVSAPEAAPDGATPAEARTDKAQAVIAGAIVRGGGRRLGHAGTAVVAEFPSAVEAVRAAVDVQATLRARNRACAPESRVAFRMAIILGEVVDGGGEIPDETLAAAARLVGRAGPEGVCLSRSIRDAVVSKLKLHMLDVTVDGEPPDARPAPAAARRSRGAPPALRRLLSRLGAAPGRAGAAAAIAGLGLAAVLLAPDTAREPPPQPSGGPLATVVAPAADAALGASPATTEPKPAGTLEFMPAHAPDPSAVLTARRMLPQAWSECRNGSPDKAVVACKLLLDSGIAKERELADIHVANGRALRERHELDKALASLDAALDAAPTSAAYSLRGTLHYDKGDLDKAIADYSEAIRRDTGNGEAFNNRAWTYYRAGRAAEALPDADAAVRLLAGEAYAWDTRAHIHVALGNREAAIRDFRAALAIDPKHAASRDGLAGLGVN